MGKLRDWRRSLNRDLSCRLRNRRVPNVADLAMLLVGRLGVPMAGRIRTQSGDRQGECYGKKTDG
jgi:hypothetical protein